MSLREQLLPKIEDEEGARKAIRNGARAAYGMAGLVLFGFAFSYFTGQDALRAPLERETANWSLAGILVEAMLVAYLAFRVRSGKGWLAGSLLLILWGYEVAMKITAGTMNAGWAIFHIGLMAYVLSGVRGCWYLRNSSPPAAATS